MNKREDPEGYNTKVTSFPGGWGIRVFQGSKMISEAFVKSKTEIGRAIRNLLRWIDKCGSPSSMASASRDRWARKE